MEHGQRLAGSGVEPPSAVGERHHRRRRRDVDVVAHERRGPLPEERQVGRVHLQLLDLVGTGALAHHVVRDLHRRAEHRRGSRRRHGRADVDRLPLFHAIDHRIRQVLDELPEHLRARLAHVVVDQHEPAAREGQRRHDLMARLAVIDDDRVGEVLAVLGGDQDDPCVAVRRAGIRSRRGGESTLAPGDVHPPRAIEGHCRIGIGAEREFAGRRALVELGHVIDPDGALHLGLLAEPLGERQVVQPPRELPHQSRRELLLVIHPRQEDAVHIGTHSAGQAEPPVRDVDFPRSRVHGQHGALAERVALVADPNGRIPGGAAVDGPPQEDVAAHGLTRRIALEQRVGHVDGARRDGLPDHGPALAGCVDRASQRRRTRDVHRHPRLVHEIAVHARPGLEQTGAEVGKRVAALLVVVVDETADEDGALARGAAVEREASVVHQPAVAGPDDRIGPCRIALEGRRGALGRLVLRVARHERAGPALAPVGGREQPEPRVTELGALIAARQVHRAVVVHTGQHMQGIAGGDRH